MVLVSDPRGASKSGNQGLGRRLGHFSDEGMEGIIY